MAIALPRNLPAWGTLLREGVEVLAEDELSRWGRRPLRICLVNLMPNKPVTETQIARLLGATALPVALTLCVPDSYHAKTTSADHMEAFYRPWSHIRDESFDAVIVSGAPIETLPFEDVTYWSDLCGIFDWARSRTIGSFYICWAAQAALRHFHRVPKHLVPAKLFGVFRQHVASVESRLLRGFGDEFPVPVSRHTEVHAADLSARPGLTILATSPQTGPCLIEDRTNRAVYMFNHLEYDSGTLRDEFLRDRQAGKDTAVPRNYFPDDDPARAPVNVWRPYGHLLFGNWLDEISRKAWPRASDEALIQWALASPRPMPVGADDCSDILIAVADSADMLPPALRILADLGIAPRALKVHRPRGSDQLIEIRADRLDQTALERVAHRLCDLRPGAKVAFRARNGIAGWFVDVADPATQPRCRSDRAAAIRGEAA